MKIFFLGQGPIAERVFEYWFHARNTSVTITGASSNTRIDQWWRTSEIFKLCTAARIPFVANDRRDNHALLAAVDSSKADWLVSVQHPWVLTTETLNIVGGKAVNLHTGPLPTYGGFNGISHAILDGASEYGVTLHWMTEHVDSGPVIARESFPVDGDVTAKELYRMTFDAAVRKMIELIHNNSFWREMPPDYRGARACIYTRHELEQHRIIRDTADIDEVTRKSLAFFFPPHFPAYTLIDGRRFYILPDTEHVRSWLSSGTR